MKKTADRVTNLVKAVFMVGFFVVASILRLQRNAAPSVKTGELPPFRTPLRSDQSSLRPMRGLASGTV